MNWRRRKEDFILHVLTYDCIGCGECVKRCRRNVLKLADNGQCRYAVVAYPGQCVGCKKCLSVCQTGALELITISKSYNLLGNENLE